ncbi:hypothetical protein [Mesorhizobium waimense]|uniref:hypothetical protein n=1 Tax=Mesorhizobium waimense TaxID=1300307 RepID=UPI001ABF8695|nr:hypothetical protein [Mesorhizobium waimense]
MAASTGARLQRKLRAPLSRLQPLRCWWTNIRTLHPTVLREGLHLQERWGLALLLAGNTHPLAGTRRDVHAMDQIESRIGMRFEIGHQRGRIA